MSFKLHIEKLAFFKHTSISEKSTNKPLKQIIFQNITVNEEAAPDSLESIEIHKKPRPMKMLRFAWNEEASNKINVRAMC